MEMETSSLDTVQKTTDQKKPEKSIAPVVKGKVKERKKSFGERLFDLFIPGDPKTIVHRVIAENLVPGIKNTIQDTFEESLDSFLHDGAPSTRRGRRRVGSQDRESYSRYYDDKERRTKATYGRGDVLRAHGVVDELIFETRDDASSVLESMERLVGEYGCASVHDLYGFCRKETDYTKEKWGWYDVSDARISRVRDGWLLTFGEPVVIK